MHRGHEFNKALVRSRTRAMISMRPQRDHAQGLRVQSDPSRLMHRGPSAIMHRGHELNEAVVRSRT